MRIRVHLAATAVLAACLLAPVAGSAETVPTADQIVKSLMPTSTVGATRGIRIAPAAPMATTPAAAAAHAQPPAAPAVSLTVEFATGSADLTPNATRVLDSLGKALTDQALASYRFRIEGHTDTVGSRDFNKELSDRRAVAVVDYLANNFHVDRARVQAVGMGKDGLLVATPDQTPEPRNRRVQVVNIGS
jgi:outer membrane protein OmpA-like peptidoglycan-associated protein